jgi:hypothetical protein
MNKVVSSLVAEKKTRKSCETRRYYKQENKRNKNQSTTFIKKERKTV